MNDETDLQKTALHRLHDELGGRLVPFAGWELPIQYEGVVAEHRWCRSSASLFDVSHMATFDIVDNEANVAAIEGLTPTNLATLKPGRSRYGLFTTFDGGILDDFIVTRLDSKLRIVSNAARRSTVTRILSAALPHDQLQEVSDVALLALQGPAAASVIAQLNPAATRMNFMGSMETELADVPVTVSRSGYTGEDGFELSVPNTYAETLARRLLDFDTVQPAGLGARDSLRLEAGLCLYGNDLDESTTPIEADLGWTIGKARRKRADFPGAKIIIDQIENGPQRIRVGVLAQGRRPIRDNTKLTDLEGNVVGTVSSGGYGPTLDAPVAMAYVNRPASEIHTKLNAHVRDNIVSCVVAELPFSPTNYFKG